MEVIDNCCVLAVVGQQMCSRKGVAATVFAALAKANINIRCCTFVTRHVHLLLFLLKELIWLSVLSSPCFSGTEGPKLVPHPPRPSLPALDSLDECHVILSLGAGFLAIVCKKGTGAGSAFESRIDFGMARKALTVVRCKVNLQTE